ncbi:unnamed protein product [Urochloa humidicola]
MESEAAADPCAICLSDVGRGQAICTAECSHVFHHRCISASVAHGHRNCPLYKAAWRDLPAVGGPDRRPPPPPPRATPQPSHHGPYDDDDPVVEQAPQDEGQAADHAVMALKTHCERPALARGASRGSFAVLVHAVAPGAAARTANEHSAAALSQQEGGRSASARPPTRRVRYCLVGQVQYKSAARRPSYD